MQIEETRTAKRLQAKVNLEVFRKVKYGGFADKPRKSELFRRHRRPRPGERIRTRYIHISSEYVVVGLND
jgi:hypothetical protein